MRRQLIASVDKAETIQSGAGFALVDILSEEQLAEAAQEGRMIWALDEKTQGPGEIVYTGTEWTCDVTAHTEESDEIRIPNPDYIDAQAEVMQSELEAITSAVATVLPTKSATKLMAQISGARKAIVKGDVSQMASVALSLSTSSTPIFDVERVKEVSDAGAETS